MGEKSQPEVARASSVMKARPNSEARFMSKFLSWADAPINPYLISPILTVSAFPPGAICRQGRYIPFSAPQLLSSVATLHWT